MPSTLTRFVVKRYGPEEAKEWRIKKEDMHGRYWKAFESRVYIGDKISYLAVQCLHGEEEVSKMAYVRRLHRSQQSFAKGPLSITTYL